MPMWLLRRVLRSDARRPDRRTYGIYDERGDYVGTIELYDLRGHEATLGIIIGERSHWGRGYGPEAIRALLDHAFTDLGLERVRLHTFADNPRAQAAFKKVGFAAPGPRAGTGAPALSRRRAVVDPPARPRRMRLDRGGGGFGPTPGNAAPASPAPAPRRSCSMLEAKCASNASRRFGPIPGTSSSTQRVSALPRRWRL
jgi:GNAT superfamily N-acetyltransferase